MQTLQGYPAVPVAGVLASPKSLNESAFLRRNFLIYELPAENKEIPSLTFNKLFSNGPIRGLPLL